MTHPTDALRLVPTDEMIRVGAWRAKLHREANPGDTWEETAREVFTVMSAAAPASPLPEGGGDNAEDFLRRVHAAAIDDIDLEYAAVNLLYGRGAIDKKTKLDAVVAVKTLRAIFKDAKRLVEPAAPTGDAK